MKIISTLSLCFISCLSFGQTTFHWRQISGPRQTLIENPDSANTLVTGLSQVGIYQYELAVTNIFGTGLDTCLVTVIDGALDIKPDSVYHFERPKIKKLEIKAITQGDKIMVQIKSPKPQEIKCRLFNFLGIELAQVDIQLHDGTNIITLPKPRISGIYILRFETYFDVNTQKIMI